MNKVIIVSPIELKVDTDLLQQIDSIYIEDNFKTIDYEEKDGFLQNLVDGWIEHYNLSQDLYNLNVDCWINEEGKMKHLPPTFQLCSADDKILDYIVGNVVFTAYNEQGDTFGLSDIQEQAVIKWLEEQKKTVVQTLKDGKIYGVYKLNGFRSVV